MKKFAVLVLAALLAASMTACGSVSTQGTPSDSLTASIIASGSDEFTEGLYFERLLADPCMVSDTDPYMVSYPAPVTPSEIVIPSVYKGVTVGIIGSLGFASAPNLTSVSIPGSIKKVFYRAFYDCPRLQTITFPEGVESLGAESLGNCTGLETIVLPASLKTIDENVVEGCDNLKAICYAGTDFDNVNVVWSRNARLKEIPIAYYSETDPYGPEGGVYWHYVDGVPTLYPRSDAYTEGLNFALTDDGAGYKVVYPYKGTETNPVIPAYYAGLPVTEIGKNCFYCAAIESVTIPETVVKIDDKAFCASEIKTIEIPASVKTLGSDCFNDSKLETITFNEGLETMGIAAFEACLIKTVKLPNSLKAIPDHAFQYCEQLKEVWFDQQNSQLTSIGYWSFNRCPELVKITLPNSLTYIENNAFKECGKLSTVDFGTGSRHLDIRDKAFTGCVSLTNLTFPNGTEIGYCVLNGCNNPTKITLLDGPLPTVIQNSAFLGHKGLQSINIPSCVKYIGYSAFAQCSSLKQVYVSEKTGWTYYNEDFDQSTLSTPEKAAKRFVETCIFYYKHD